jgi:hypothetical protein
MASLSKSLFKTFKPSNVQRSNDSRNEQGLIVERTVALRPYPALKLFRDAMYSALKDKLPPDVWDCATP